MNHSLTPEQMLQVSAEKSRKLHDRLVECDAALRELEDNPTQCNVATFNLIFQAITRLREQIRADIERMQG